MLERTYFCRLAAAVLLMLGSAAALVDVARDLEPLLARELAFALETGAAGRAARLPMEAAGA